MHILNSIKRLWKIKKFKNRIIKREGGEKESLSLREYVKKTYKVDVGLYTYGSCFEPSFNVGGEVEIGRYCSFGPNVHYFGANHPIDHAVMSAYFYNKSFGGLEVNDVERFSLNVGNDVWIGYGVTIVSSCRKIGDGSVIAAGSVVTDDVPPYAIVGGVPAKIIRYRFDEKTIDMLQSSKWWEKSPEKLMKWYSIIHLPLEWARQVKEGA